MVYSSDALSLNLRTYIVVILSVWAQQQKPRGRSHGIVEIARSICHLVYGPALSLAERINQRRASMTFTSRLLSYCFGPLEVSIILGRFAETWGNSSGSRLPPSITKSVQLSFQPCRGEWSEIAIVCAISLGVFATLESQRVTRLAHRQLSEPKGSRKLSKVARASLTLALTMDEIRPWATNKKWILFLPRPPTLQLTLKLRNLRLHLRHQHGTMGKIYRKHDGCGIRLRCCCPSKHDNWTFSFACGYNHADARSYPPNGTDTGRNGCCCERQAGFGTSR